MIKADWTSHHIEGYAFAAAERGWDANMFADLLTHTYTDESGGELWQGGFVAGVDLTDEGFDQIISLYPWGGKYIVDILKTDIIEVHAYDSPDQDPLIFVELGELAGSLVSNGKKVLVHCQAGLNRSGVVTALALINLGYESAKAVELMREKRSPLVLCNEAFESWVLEQ